MDSGILNVVIFVAASGCFLAISRKSLRNVRSHGFYRFFAWEAILALILINAGVWFADPFSLPQIFSWLFLFVSLELLQQGVSRILATGKPNDERSDDTLLEFEKTTNLITSGIYRYIRHPLYGSLLFLAWGAFLKELSWYSVCLVLAATLFLIATAKADETECIRYFGISYEEYMLKTKMFIPFIF